MQFKTIVIISIVFFFLGICCTYYYFSRINVSNFSKRIAEYQRLMQQYQVRESELKNTITKLQFDNRTITELAKSATNQVQQLKSINDGFNKQITELRTNNQSVIESSNRIDQSTDRIGAIIQRVINRGKKGN